MPGIVEQEIVEQEYLSFGRVGRRYGKHSSTPFRWWKDGVAGVKLKTVSRSAIGKLNSLLPRVPQERTAAGRWFN